MYSLKQKQQINIQFTVVPLGIEIDEFPNATQVPNP